MTTGNMNAALHKPSVMPAQPEYWCLAAPLPQSVLERVASMISERKGGYTASLGVKRMTRGQNGVIIPSVPLSGADVANPAVTMGKVVPTHKVSGPSARACARSAKPLVGNSGRYWPYGITIPHRRCRRRPKAQSTRASSPASCA